MVGLRDSNPREGVIRAVKSSLERGSKDSNPREGVIQPVLEVVAHIPVRFKPP